MRTNIENKLFSVLHTVVGCSNDDLEKFETNATIEVFRASDVVTYTCQDGYNLVGDGQVVCNEGSWKGDPGRCIPKSVGKS